MPAKKTIIVGECNPHPPHDPLVPYPKNSTGWKVWSMMSARTGISPEKYRQKIIRVNLCPAGWDDDHAAGAAEALWKRLRKGDRVLILGEKARRAMGLPKLLIHPVVVRGIVFRQIPHPSGKNRFYNDATQREIACMVLEDLYEHRRNNRRANGAARRLPGRRSGRPAD